MDHEKIPDFHQPTEYLVPQISNLLNDTAYLENGIAFKGEYGIMQDGDTSYVMYTALCLANTL